MGYFDNKTELINHAKYWNEKMETECLDETEMSTNGSLIYKDNNLDIRPHDVSLTHNTDICIVQSSTTDAIYKYSEECHGDKIAALNFASYKNPGGMFLNGSSAQEETLCHESNLYNILKRLEDRFYVPNRKRLNNSLYNSNLIYTPSVYFESVNLDEVYCDIITCAAPNRTAARRYKRVPDDIINEHMKDRIDHVLFAALDQHVDVLILGAFGCGVFGNEPKVVAKIFKNFLETDYKGCFKKVVFAIPAGKNYDKFKEVFSNEHNKQIL